MDSPQHILEVGTIVRTHKQLGSTGGMIVREDALKRRRPDVIGVIGPIVGGHGGDVYWVFHGPEEQPAPYSFAEFELDDSVTVSWKLHYKVEGADRVHVFHGAPSKEERAKYPSGHIVGPYFESRRGFRYL